MEFSLFFFGAESSHPVSYRTFFDATRFADSKGFTAAWVPERHFMRFGGLYGSPSIMATALSLTTSNLGIRAGSVVLPLHHPLRVAEEWAIVDNFSNGRVAIAAASGWHVNDFVLAPEIYASRRDDMYQKLAMVQRLWRGEAVEFPNGEGRLIPITITPRPLQPELPIWLTAASRDGCAAAGSRGFNLLTANFSHKYQIATLSAGIAAYRTELQKSFDKPGHVTLMVHTYVGESWEMVRKLAFPALSQYLDSNVDMQAAYDAGRQMSRGFLGLEGRRREILVRVGSAAPVHGELSLIGTKDSCHETVRILEEAGVDELACLIDFGIPHAETMAGLHRLTDVMNRLG